MKVTKNTTLEKILKLQRGEELLKKHKVPCMSCPTAAQELGVLKLSDVCQFYGLDLKSILTDLNK